MEIIPLISGVAFLIWLFIDNSQKKREQEKERWKKEQQELEQQELEKIKEKQLQERLERIERENLAKKRAAREKRKKDKILAEEKKVAEVKRKANLEAKRKRKLAEKKKLETLKYEIVEVVVCRIEDKKPSAVLRKDDDTYAFVERKSEPFTLNSNIKISKETVDKLEWVSKSSYLAREKRNKEERKLILDSERYNFEEKETSYANDLKLVFDADERNFGYSKIRQLSIEFWRTISDDEQNRLYRELERGVAILDTCDQLKYYHFSFGKKHKKKLDVAFDALSLSPNGQAVEIVDYGCGQALASVMFVDFCKSNNLNFNIDKVILLEPSEAALKRGALNTKLSLESFNSNAKVCSVNKRMNDVLIEDIETKNENIKIHLFSNILDVDGVHIESLAKKIKTTQTGKNIFVCVSPNFFSDGTNYRNKKLVDFHSNFNVSPILHTFSDIGYIIVFQTGF